MKVLHELANLDGGGVARLLYDYYSYMDHNLIQFDFVISTDIEHGILEAPLTKLGCKIYKIPSFKKNKKLYLKSLKEIIKNGKYDAVHTHKATRGLFFLYYAKMYKVPIRIAHSHIAYEDISFKARLINKILARINKRLATQLFACGKDAAVYMWGEKAVFNDKVLIMRNAIDVKKFKYSPEIRNIKRQELGIEKKFVIGCVGRLTKQKNQIFLLEVISKLSKLRNDFVLLLIGRGEDESKLKYYANKLGISEYIIFLGIRDDVCELLNAMDLFVLPSLYEGLPVVLIEAQANGVPELVSDKITREVYITDCVKYLSINEGPDLWAEEIKEYRINPNERINYDKVVKQAGYDIISESQIMQKFYLNNHSLYNEEQIS